MLKAWEMVGFTYEGDVYCFECVPYTDPTVTGESATDTRVNMPAPIFVSDEVPSDWVCTVCEGEVG